MAKFPYFCNGQDLFGLNQETTNQFCSLHIYGLIHDQYLSNTDEKKLFVQGLYCSVWIVYRFADHGTS